MSEPDDLEELEEEEIPASAVSFFADDDEAACEAIFALYLKDSARRGLAPAETTRGTFIREHDGTLKRPPPKSAPTERAEGSNDMSSNAEVKGAVLGAYRVLERKLGRHRATWRS